MLPFLFSSPSSFSFSSPPSPPYPSYSSTYYFHFLPHRISPFFLSFLHLPFLLSYSNCFDCVQTRLADSEREKEQLRAREKSLEFEAKEVRTCYHAFCGQNVISSFVLSSYCVLRTIAFCVPPSCSLTLPDSLYYE